MSDLVSRQQAIDAIRKLPVLILPGGVLLGDVLETIRQLPSAQPEQPLLDTYAKAVWTWLIDYQIKAAELKGRYAPYEVLSWVANDWRKEHDMPSAHPEIIRCRECKFASGDSRICMKFGHSPIGELDFCAWAERRTDEE